LEVAVFDHHVTDRVAIRAIKAIAPVIEAQTELAVAGDGFARAGERMKAEIHAANVDRLGLAELAVDDFATAEAVGDVNPVVEGQSRMIGAELRIQLGETLEPGFIDVGSTVAVGVFHVGQPAGKRDEYATFPRLETGGEEELVGECRGGFKN